MRLLYVEDSEDTRAAGTLALRLHGHEVEPFASAPSAVEALEGGLGVDAIVLDWALSCYPGQWFLDECSFRGLARGVPVVILTGYPNLAAGAEVAATLLKPVNMDELEMTLKEVTAPAWRNRHRPAGASPVPPRAQVAQST
jgi:DNA-binding NtrC family response regulator